MEAEEDSPQISYDNFINTFLLYQRLFDYSGSVDDILELPYCMYNDIILNQIKIKQKEKEELENLKTNANNNSPFKKKNPMRRR